MFWVISQPNIDGFCLNMGHFKGQILLDRPETVSYRYLVWRPNKITIQKVWFVWLAAILNGDPS